MHAIVRDVPSTLDRAIRAPGDREPIDVLLAQEQHARYCDILEDLGLSLIRLPADPRFPDCCFVEDTALVVGAKAIIPFMGAESRRGETAAVEAVLRRFKRIERIESPARLDGGDVLFIGRHAYVGLSERTNAAAVEQLRAILAIDRYEVVPVRVHRALHLKSAVSYLGRDVALWFPGSIERHAFAALRLITVPAGERYAANCLAINDTVLVPAGAPRTRSLVEAAGFETVEVDLSELGKAAGGLSCCSIIFDLSSH